MSIYQKPILFTKWSSNLNYWKQKKIPEADKPHPKKNGSPFHERRPINGPSRDMEVKIEP